MLGSPGRNQSWLPSPDPEKVKLGPQQRESSAKVLCLALCPAFSQTQGLASAGGGGGGHDHPWCRPSCHHL